jgi:hypothetical protein
MIDIIELVPHRDRPQHVQHMTSKVGHTLLEYMQESRNRPCYAPTVMVSVVKRGTCTDFVPVNPLAKLFAKLIGRSVLNEGHLVLIEEMGFAVERRLS